MTDNKNFHLFMWRFILKTFSLILMGSLQLASADITPDDHLHGLGQCVQCHVDGIDVSILIAEDKSCSNCHDATTLQVFTEKLAKGDYSFKKEKITSKVKSKVGQGVYYEKSKLADEPNEMKNIAAGKFIMGSNERLSDEGPQHEVDLKAFAIDIYEVTNGQYKKFIDATGRRSPSHFRNRTYPKGKVDHPVTFVNWEDANAYCQWVGKRLPTDQEWEKAARGADGRTYPWGEEFANEKANTPLRWKSLGKFGDTMPVGFFEGGISPHGIYDMSGNVWEWTSSWYKAYPGNKTFSESYGERYKTLKGGSWFDCSFYKCGISAPVYNRAFFAKKVKNDTFGFRCAKDI